MPLVLQKPTGIMRLLAYTGTAAFAGILGYMYWEKQRLEVAQQQQAAKRQWD